jgi:hypothetical protein
MGFGHSVGGNCVEGGRAGRGGEKEGGWGGAIRYAPWRDHCLEEYKADLDQIMTVKCLKFSMRHIVLTEGQFYVIYL